MTPVPKRSFVKMYAPMIMPLIFFAIVIFGVWTSWKWLSSSGDDPNKGKTAVPATRANIQAYTKITRDHLKVLYLDESKLPESVYLKFSDVIGRVLAKDKRANYVFTEKDFLEKGARAGLAGAIPPGKKAFTIETDNVQGLYGLNRGDSFDLMGIFKHEEDPSFQAVGGAHSIGEGIAEPTLIVRRGKILIPLRTRSETYTQTSLTQGKQVKNKPVRETVIAVSSKEVQALAQATSMGAELYVVPVSEVADESSTDESEGSLFAKINVVETLKGGKRNRVAVPSS